MFFVRTNENFAKLQLQLAFAVSALPIRKAAFQSAFCPLHFQGILREIQTHL